MQSHRSWQPFNVNAGVKGEAEDYSCQRRSFIALREGPGSIRRAGPRTAIWVKAEEAEKSPEEMLFIYHEAHGPGAVREEA